MERCDADVEKRNGCWMLELAELDRVWLAL